LLALVATVAVAEAQTAAPTVSTGAATSIKQHSAVLNGSVRPNGANATWYFQFGTTNVYGRKTSNRTASAGNGTQSVGRNVTGLLSGTVYHYRIVATNSSGTSLGADRTFTTTGPTQIAPVVTLASNKNPVNFGHSARLAGQVSGPGNSGAVVSLQAKPFPYTGPFVQIGNSVVTNSTGLFAFTINPLLNGQYRAVARRNGVDVSSSILIQKVRLSVSTKVGDSTPRVGQRVRFSGSVKPSHVGVTVRVQRRTSSGDYVTIATGHTKAATSTRASYSVRARIRKTGYYRVRVSSGDGDHSAPARPLGKRQGDRPRAPPGVRGRRPLRSASRRECARRRCACGGEHSPP
jgi:hypothetical protein